MIEESSTPKSPVPICLIITVSSIAVSIANLIGSLRVLDVTRSTITLSLAVTLYNIFFTVMSLSWTRLFIGRLSRRSIIALSVFSLFASLILISVDNTVSVITGIVLVGVSSAVFSPLLTTILIDYTGKDALAVSRYNLCSSIGLIIGYLLGGVLEPLVGINGVSEIASITVVLLTPVLFLIPKRYAVIEPRRLTYISFIPNFTGRIRPLPSIIFTPKIVYNAKKLVVDFVRMAKMRLARKLPLMLLSTSILFAGISVFFTPIRRSSDA
ncbi:MAG: MFS transporter [Desulfurococcales archaeon]|nr:MFS transporter [Desulfurococcales archaeon]